MSTSEQQAVSEKANMKVPLSVEPAPANPETFNVIGLHCIVDCVIRDTKGFLNDKSQGLAFFDKIIKEFELSLCIPPICVEFPTRENFKGIIPIDDVKLLKSPASKARKFFESNSFQIKKGDPVQGYSLVGIIAESHISMHTYPELGYFAFDLYSCKEFDQGTMKRLLTEDFDVVGIQHSFIGRNTNNNVAEKACTDRHPCNLHKCKQLDGNTHISEDYGHHKWGLRVEKMLVDIQSTYQHIQLFENKNYGKVLVLDGQIQITEKDYFVYNEMMAHVPLHAHPSPDSCLVIGGGDGAVLTEVLKHDYLQHVTICEIDEKVISTCMEHFPQWKDAWTEKRVTLVTDDAQKHIANLPDASFSVIVVDCSDPYEGLPAASLFAPEFFNELYRVLKPDGVVCIQSECMYLEHDRAMIKRWQTDMRKIFPHVAYGTMSVPTYMCGQIGMLLCSKIVDPREVHNKVCGPIKGLKYYNQRLHAASFVLPNYYEYENL